MRSNQIGTPIRVLLVVRRVSSVDSEGGTVELIGENLYPINLQVDDDSPSNQRLLSVIVGIARYRGRIQRAAQGEPTNHLLPRHRGPDAPFGPVVGDDCLRQDANLH